MADFTPEQRRRFDEGVDALLQRYPTEHKGAALLEVLHLVQELLGWLPLEVMPAVADRLEIPVVRVKEVAGFYTMYHLEKPGRHLIEVCTNPSCQVRGADELVRRVCDHFGIKPGQTSSDGRVTLEIAECLGSCGTAPVMAVDREYRENITRSKLQQIFDEIDKD